MGRREHEPPAAGVAIAELARVLSDPSRVAMLDVLLDGDGHPIGELARAAAVSAATASSHLRQLAAASFVVVERRGREHRVRLADAERAELLERLAALTAPVEFARPHRNELRFARTCYDHLAGVLAVLLVDALVARAWLHRTTDNLEPAPALLAWLADHGQTVEVAGKRPLSRACVDGTERVAHVAGRIGTSLASVFMNERWVTRVRETRALRVTDRGRIAIARELGLVLPVARRG